MRSQFDPAFASPRSLPIRVRWRLCLSSAALLPLWNRSAAQPTAVWLLVPSAITVPNVEAYGLPLPLRPSDATSWPLRYFASYRRRERLTPFSANRSWSFAPLCRDRLGLRRRGSRLAPEQRPSLRLAFPVLGRLAQVRLRALRVPVRPSLVLGLGIVRRRPFLRFFAPSTVV